MKKIITILALVLLLAPSSVNASSGRLKKDSIIQCNGVSYGQHGDGHWHQAKQNSSGYWDPVGDAFSSKPCQNQPSNNGSSGTNIPSGNSGSSNTTTPAKSSDNTLLSLKVDSEAVIVMDEMRYETQKERVEVVAIANSDKATVDYDETAVLSVGENEIPIIVTAENASKKSYRLVIVRQGILPEEDELQQNEPEKDVVAGPEETGDAGAAIVGLGIMGGAGYGIYRLAKKKKAKK
jgi:hypothetical protein